MRVKKIFQFAGIIVALSPSLVSAEIFIGETTLIPSFGLTYFTDDNVFNQNTNVKEESGILYQPSIEWTADKGLNSVTLQYTGNFTHHDESENADYDDHDFVINGELEFSSRSRLSLIGRRFNGHEPANTGRSRSLVDKTGELTEYSDTGFTGVYRYGAETAKGGLEFGLEHADRNYSNNETVTDGFSFSRFTPSFTFLYAISSATRIASGIEYSAFDFESADTVIEQDSNNWFLFTGANWDVTGKSGGNLKFGYGQQDFSNENRDDQSSFLVRFQGYWEPKEHAIINAEIRRNFGFDTISPSVLNQISLSWVHDWSSFLSSTIVYNWLDSESDNLDSEYTRTIIRVNLDFTLRRWLSLNLFVENSEKTSPDLEEQFEKLRLGGGGKITF